MWFNRNDSMLGGSVQIVEIVQARLENIIADELSEDNKYSVNSNVY